MVLKIGDQTYALATNSKQKAAAAEQALRLLLKLQQKGGRRG